MKNKSKRVFPKYVPGEIVEIVAGTLYYDANWLRENGMISQSHGKIFGEGTRGVYLRASNDSGPMYKIIEIDGEHFEVFHVNIKKLN